MEDDKNTGWGGPWTEKKLDAFAKYVWSYLTIMKAFPYWETIYFDGFAGSGSRGSKNDDLLQQLSIIPKEQRIYRGAAERVLKIQDQLQFNYYYFIDQSEKSLQKLKARLSSLPEAENKKLEFRSGNANRYLLELSKALKQKKYAALVFLDPFGMQIDWKSIEELKGTRSDVWILIPTGVIINRLLDKRGELPHLSKLESFFGLSADAIRTEFYHTERSPTLFDEEKKIVRKVLNPIEKIANLYTKRLETVWDYVTPKPLRLYNSRGVPIFHFVFASNNANAVNIAKQIINKP